MGAVRLDWVERETVGRPTDLRGADIFCCVEERETEGVEEEDTRGDGELRLALLDTDGDERLGWAVLRTELDRAERFDGELEEVTRLGVEETVDRGLEDG